MGHQWTTMQSSGTTHVYNYDTMPSTWGENNTVGEEGIEIPLESQLKSMKKSRKNRTVVAGLVGGAVGLVTLGPVGAVLFGYGSAVTTKEIGKQKERKIKRKHQREQEQQQQWEHQQQQQPKQGRWKRMLKRQ